MPDIAALLPAVVALAERAGRAVLDHWRQGPAVRRKADASPVTAADEAAEAVILEGLEALAPGQPVVAEEAVAAGRVAEIGQRPFWLVDPLDGTREFLAGRDEFTVNIALVAAGQPVLGVLHAPARAVTWWGAPGQGAWRREAGGTRPIRVRPPPAGGPLALLSRSHADQATLDRLARLGVRSRRRLGSALKFGLLAEGGADVYVRLGPTMEWDTAAGDAVLRAAGGHTRTPDGAPLAYGKPDFRNPGFIAAGG